MRHVWVHVGRFKRNVLSKVQSGDYSLHPWHQWLLFTLLNIAWLIISLSAFLCLQVHRYLLEKQWCAGKGDEQHCQRFLTSQSLGFGLGPPHRWSRLSYSLGRLQICQQFEDAKLPDSELQFQFSFRVQLWINCLLFCTQRSYFLPAYNVIELTVSFRILSLICSNGSTFCESRILIHN